LQFLVKRQQPQLQVVEDKAAVVHAEVAVKVVEPRQGEPPQQVPSKGRVVAVVVEEAAADAAAVALQQHPRHPHLEVRTARSA
jgi:hypothetical protein